MSLGTIKLLRHMSWLLGENLKFNVISLWLCFAALFLHVKPAQLLHFLLSTLWCRQIHQSGTLSSNYPPPTILCQAGTCPFCRGWHWWFIQPVSAFLFYCRLSSLTTGRRSEDIKPEVIIPIVLGSIEAQPDAWRWHTPALHRGTLQDYGLSTICDIS